MLRTLLISASSGSANSLRYLADGCGIFLILKDFQTLPSSFELQRSLTLEPEIVMFTTTDDTAALAAQIQKQSPHTLLIGIGASTAKAGISFSCQLGNDATPEEILAAVTTAVADRLSANNCRLISFMPAKAGSGSSTIALNVAACLAREHRQRVLVIDADLRSSVLTAMVGHMPRTGIEVLFDQFDSMTTLDLDRHPVQWHGVDLLLSTRSVDGAPPTAAHYLRLLTLAGERYDAIVTDLPELVNPATLAVVRASRELFVVCTPEVPTLTLAKQRLSELGRLGLLDDRIGIIVNRRHRTDPDRNGLAELLDQPRIYTLPNDYPSVRKSFAAYSPIASSKLADGFREFTSQLLDSEETHSGMGETLKSLFGLRRSRIAPQIPDPSKT